MWTDADMLLCSSEDEPHWAVEVGSEFRDSDVCSAIVAGRWLSRATKKRSQLAGTRSCSHAHATAYLCSLENLFRIVRCATEDLCPVRKVQFARKLLIVKA